MHKVFLIYKTNMPTYRKIKNNACLSLCSLRLNILLYSNADMKEARELITIKI